MVAAYLRSCDAHRAYLTVLEKTGASEADVRRFSVGAANGLSNLADWQSMVGDYPAADASDAEAEFLAVRLGDPELVAHVLVQRAARKLPLGRYNAAVSALLRARDVLHSPQFGAPALTPATSLYLRVSGDIYRWLGDALRARQCADYASGLLEDLRPLPQSSKLFELRLHQVFLYVFLEDWNRATELLDEVESKFGGVFASSIASVPVPYAGMAGALARVVLRPQRSLFASGFRLHRALVAEGRGDLAGALKIIDEDLLPAVKQIPALAAKEGEMRVLRARVLRKTGQPAEALADAEASVVGQMEHGQTERLWAAHGELARVRRLLGDIPGALNAYEAAAAAVDALRPTSLGYRLDNLSLAKARPLFDEAIVMASEQGNAERCLRLADLVKSRFLAASLLAEAAGNPRPAVSVPPELDRIGAEIDALERAHERNMLAGNAAYEQSNSSRRETLIAERAALLEQLRVDAAATEPPATRFDVGKTIADLGQRRQAALQLFRAADVVVAVLLDGEGLDVASLSLTSRTVENLHAYARNLQLLYDSPTERDPDEFGLTIDKLVPPHLLERALAGASLLFAPHEILNLLPWPALRLCSHRLFERVPVGIVPNIASIRPLAARPAARPKVALVGAPDYDSPTYPKLPQAAAELDDIAALYGDECLLASPLLGPAATCSAVRRLLSEETPGSRHDGILHLSCHGSFEASDPAGSGLILNDRRLTAGEIALLPLPFREVVLSACSTGYRPTTLGDVQLHGDDVVGLPASLLEAGAATVLVSIPKAHDSASRKFFVTYHRRRRNGEEPLAAFAGTQQDLLHEHRLRPHGWVGLVMYGCR